MTSAKEMLGSDFVPSEQTRPRVWQVVGKAGEVGPQNSIPSKLRAQGIELDRSSRGGYG